MHKIKDFKKLAVIVSLLLVILFVAIRVIPFVGTTTETKDYSELIEVKDGISVVSGLEDEVGEEELSELIEEYGTDANIIIYDIGY